MGSVAHIFVAPHRGAPMKRLDDAYAIAGEGLSGDRYAEAANRPSASHEVTLIEAEHIDAFARELRITFTPEMPRRNIVTAEVSLNDLLGKRFRVGDAVLEGLELCEPCRLFARRTHRAVRTFFVGKGGLRARIVTGGRIRVGDKICGDD